MSRRIRFEIAMIVGIGVAELHIPEARSLKDKRRVVKSLLDRVHSRFRVSAAEVEFQDLRQRARLGFSLVNSDRTRAHATLDEIGRLLETADAFVTRWETQILEDPQ